MPGNMQAQPVRADSTLVIQGRITAIENTLVTLKTPNGFPGGPGPHAQFVTAGPDFKVDISHARVLLPDGKQSDKLPLAVGDQVLMVLTGPDSQSPAPAGSSALTHTYFASVIERIAPSDKVITH
jgi:hypothetical protein